MKRITAPAFVQAIMDKVQTQKPVPVEPVETIKDKTE